MDPIGSTLFAVVYTGSWSPLKAVAGWNGHGNHERPTYIVRAIFCDSPSEMWACAPSFFGEEVTCCGNYCGVQRREFGYLDLIVAQKGKSGRMRMLREFGSWVQTSSTRPFHFHFYFHFHIRICYSHPLLPTLLFGSGNPGTGFNSLLERLFSYSLCCIDLGSHNSVHDLNCCILSCLHFGNHQNFIMEGAEVVLYPQTFPQPDQLGCV